MTMPEIAAKARAQVMAQTLFSLRPIGLVEWMGMVEDYWEDGCWDGSVL